MSTLVDCPSAIERPFRGDGQEGIQPGIMSRNLRERLLAHLDRRDLPRQHRLSNVAGRPKGNPGHR
jgi:hypothetical protein